MNISVDEAFKRDPITARESIESELRQMLTKGVFRPVHAAQATSKIIPSKIFLKEKRVYLL